MQAFSTIHATARRYAEAGIPVFPCKEDGKEPATDNGFKDSTTDLTIIDNWWEQNPNFNLAICPEFAGLFVVDIDPGAAKSDISMLPQTYTVRTPRGGWHFYYEGTGRTTASKFAPHIDTRGVGGYVLVPPSKVKGAPYIIEHNIPYQPVPSTIKEKLTVIDAPQKTTIEDIDLPANIERAKQRLQYYIGKEDVAVEGQGGDYRTYKICCELRDLGLSIETAFDLLTDQHGWNDHCMPPWPDEALMLKMMNAANYQQNQTGAYGVEPAQKVFGSVIKNLSQDTKLPRFYFKDEQEQDDELDPTWMIKELITERSTVLLYGTSGSYKSFMVLDICLAVATGQETFGTTVKAGPVFYGALEGKAHLKKGRRAWRMMKGIEGKIDNFFVGRAPMVADPAEVQAFGDEIRKRCKDQKPALIVIDTLSKSMAGLNENDASDANRFITFCDSLVEEFGCTVIAVHHASDKAEGKGSRGSSAFFAGFDTVLEVVAHKPTKAVAIWVKKQKDVEERFLPFTFEGRVLGPSLVFEATTIDQHKALTGETKLTTPRSVAQALKKLGAIGENAAVSTAVLATEITPAKERETVEDRGREIARTSRMLVAEANGALEGYITRKGREYTWHLISPKADDV